MELKFVEEYPDSQLMVPIAALKKAAIAILSPFEMSTMTMTVSLDSVDSFDQTVVDFYLDADDRNKVGIVIELPLDADYIKNMPIKDYIEMQRLLFLDMLSGCHQVAQRLRGSLVHDAEKGAWLYKGKADLNAMAEAGHKGNAAQLQDYMHMLAQGLSGKDLKKPEFIKAMLEK